MLSRRITRWITAMVMAVALALVCAPTSATYAASGRNNANAKLCQKGGWQNYQRTDGTRFANQDECVSYAAQGGTLVPIPTDTTQPSCSYMIIGGPPAEAVFTIQDSESGLASIEVTQSSNVDTFVQGFTPGTTDSVTVRNIKINQVEYSDITIRVTDVSGNVTECPAHF